MVIAHGNYVPKYHETHDNASKIQELKKKIWVNYIAVFSGKDLSS